MGGARRRKVPLLNGVAVLLVLVVVPVLLVSLRSHPAGHPARAGASASPSQGPLTPEQYQSALDLFKNAVPSLAELANAHTGTAVSSASEEYNSALTDAETKLNLITPPAAVASAHHQFASAVDGLRLVVDSVVSTSICGGSSALSHIGSSPEAAQVRTAAKALAAADPAHPYTIVDFLPPATPDANRRLGTGTVIKKAFS